MRSARGCLIRFVVLFCAVGAARGAFTIEPASVIIDASAGERTALVEVVNTGDAPVAVALTLFERVLDLEGELDRKAMVPCKDFTIYPSEIIIYPKESASVQLLYKDKLRVKEDKAYLLFSSEVPLRLEEEDGGGVETGIQMLMNYYTVVAFETGKTGKLTFVSSKAIKDGYIEVIVENKSGGRVKADKLAIKTDTDLITSFTGAKNSIMPGQKRRFTFKYLRPLTSKEVKFVY